MNLRYPVRCINCAIKQTIGLRHFDPLFTLRNNPMSTGFLPTNSIILCQKRYFAYKSKEIKSLSSIKTKNEQHLNFVYVVTSKERWVEFETGLVFDVGLFDSFANKEFDQRVPVILGIPGCIGSHEDLTKYLRAFVALGYRVIVPNLPGTKYCQARTKAEEHVFTMSANEKAEFIKDVLETIDVPQVDMLVSLSDSAHASLELTAGPLFKLKNIQSLVLINPIGLDYTKSMQPLWFYKRLSNLIESNRFLAPVKKVFLNIYKRFTEKKKWTSDDILLFTRTIGALNFQEADLNAQRFKHKPLPVRVFYSDVGSHIDIPSTEHMLEIMGVPPKIEVLPDEQGKVKYEGKNEKNQQCLFFPGGLDSEKDLTFVRTELLKFLKEIRPDILEL